MLSAPCGKSATPERLVFKPQILRDKMQPRRYTRPMSTTSIYASRFYWYRCSQRMRVYA